MTTNELISEIEDFVKTIQAQGILLKFLDSIATDYQKLNALAIAMMLGEGNLDSVTAFLTARTRDLKTQGVRTVFREIDAVEGALKDFNLGAFVSVDLGFFEATVGEGPIAALEKDLAGFAKNYEAFLQNSDKRNTINVFVRAQAFYERLRDFLGALEMVTTDLNATNDPQMGSDQSSLSLFMPTSDEAAVVFSKLQSLKSIYEELCRLLNVSTSEYPLRIIRLEYGSLFAKLFGESKVILLLTDCIRSGVGFLYRNYTQEGKLGAIPRRVEEFEGVINLERKMKELGYDTTDMKESNQKSGAVIAKDLNTLLAGETAIELNGETFSLGSAVDRMIAEQSRTRLLSDGTQDDHAPAEPDSNGSAKR